VGSVGVFRSSKVAHTCVHTPCRNAVVVLKTVPTEGSRFTRRFRQSFASNESSNRNTSLFFTYSLLTIDLRPTAENLIQSATVIMRFNLRMRSLFMPMPADRLPAV